jgi:hypothetical protein
MRESSPTSRRSFLGALAAAPALAAPALVAAGAIPSGPSADLPLIQAAAECAACELEYGLVIKIDEDDPRLDRIYDRISEIQTMMMETEARTIAGVKAKADVLRGMLSGRDPGTPSSLLTPVELIAWSITDDLHNLFPVEGVHHV